MIRLWNLVQAQVEVHTFLVGGTLAFDGAKSDVRADCRLIALPLRFLQAAVICRPKPERRDYSFRGGMTHRKAVCAV